MPGFTLLFNRERVTQPSHWGAMKKPPVRAACKNMCWCGLALKVHPARRWSFMRARGIGWGVGWASVGLHDAAAHQMLL
jgi:hypothetical protein